MSVEVGLSKGEANHMAQINEILLLLYFALIISVNGEYAGEWEQGLLENGYSYRNGTSSLRRVLVVTLTSVKRKNYYRAVSETYMTELPVAMITEKGTPKCKLCGSREREGSSTALYSRTRFDEHKERSPGLPYYGWKSVDWKCAQQRPLQALKMALTDFKERRHEWLLLIDDDAYVHGEHVLRMIRGLNASKSIMFGNRIGGGAGFLMSSGAVQAFLQPSGNKVYFWDVDGMKWQEKEDDEATVVLDKCIEASVGGRYCFFHSDWLIKRCADAAGVKVEPLSNMYQNCPRGIQGLANSTDAFDNDTAEAVLSSSMWRNLLTCHRISPRTIRGLHKIKVSQK